MTHTLHTILPRATAWLQRGACAAAILAAFGVLAACQDEGGKGISLLPNAGVLANPEGDTVPVFRSISGNVIPVHVQAATAALVMRLRGASPAEVAEQLAVDGTQVVEADPAFDYDGFALLQVKILRNQPDQAQANRHHYAGVMHFENKIGRRTALAFEVDYTVANDRVKVAQMAQAPVYPEHPLTEMYVVPVDDVANAFAAAADDYDRVYRLVREKALPLSQADLPADPRKYLVTVFYKDRLSPDGKVEINIGNDRSGRGGDSSGSHYREYSGWVIGVIGAEFKLSAEKPVWVKALYTPGRDVAKARRDTRLVGLYSTGPGQGEGS
jgi:hypothetical protein